ncbi:hypothetical protein H7X65_01070 [Candidatus Parcubacteria bacterium]|nr:hypothetical protein [Candidatus Parcubacteria bacterium]
MKTYLFYFKLPNQKIVYCITPDPKNQITQDHELAGEFKTPDPEELQGFIQNGFNEAWDEVPSFRNKPEWEGFDRSEIILSYIDVPPGSRGDGGVVARIQVKK